MINPFLLSRLFEFPLRPLLIETEPGALQTVAGVFRQEGITVGNVISEFSMFALPPVPAKNIEATVWWAGSWPWLVS